MKMTTMITFAALAHALYRASKGHGRVEHADGAERDTAAAERETALLALRAALEEQEIELELELAGEHRVPNATEIAAFTPEQRVQILSLGLALALQAIQPHVPALEREERKRKLAEHRDLIVRVADAVLVAAARYLRYPEEEIELLRSAARKGPVTIPILVSAPSAEDRRTFGAWHSVLENVVEKFFELVTKQDLTGAMRRIDANDPGLILIGVMALDRLARVRHDKPNLSEYLQEIREDAKEHKIPRDIDAQIVVFLALVRQRDVLNKYLSKEGDTRPTLADDPDPVVFRACLEGATEALSLLRPASKDLGRALRFLRSRHSRITH